MPQDDPQDDSQDGSVGTIWSRIEQPRPGRQPALSHARIAAAGVAIADADGLEAVSMRRIARDLDVGTMSLYRYVRTKDELLELMLDGLLAELSLDEVAATGWRDVLAAIARQLRTMMLRHPWAPTGGLGSRPSMGPNTLRWIEESTSRLDQPGLSIDQVLDMSGSVTSFVTGSVQYELGARSAQRATGLSEEQWRERVAPYVRTVIERGEHPYFERIVVEAEDLPDAEAIFERRLGYVLDGLAAGLGLA